ncbi:MAG: VOC family protein [Phenylobacterium sp.]
MGASAFDHETTRTGLRVELFVSDVPRSIAFYREVLGFEVLRQATSGYTSMGREGAVLGLHDVASLPDGYPARPEPGHAPGRGVELVVMVSDVASLHARASASRPGKVSALTTQPWGLTDFRIVDPDGYYIRITGLAPAD